MAISSTDVAEKSFSDQFLILYIIEVQKLPNLASSSRGRSVLPASCVFQRQLRIQRTTYHWKLLLYSCQSAKNNDMTFRFQTKHLQYKQIKSKQYFCSEMVLGQICLWKKNTFWSRGGKFFELIHCPLEPSTKEHCQTSQ